MKCALLTLSPTTTKTWWRANTSKIIQGKLVWPDWARAAKNYWSERWVTRTSCRPRQRLSKHRHTEPWLDTQKFLIMTNKVKVTPPVMMIMEMATMILREIKVLIWGGPKHRKRSFLISNCSPSHSLGALLMKTKRRKLLEATNLVSTQASLLLKSTWFKVNCRMMKLLPKSSEPSLSKWGGQESRSSIKEPSQISWQMTMSIIWTILIWTLRPLRPTKGRCQRASQSWRDWGLSDRSTTPFHRKSTESKQSNRAIKTQMSQSQWAHLQGRDWRVRASGSKVPFWDSRGRLFSITLARGIEEIFSKLIIL